MFGKKKVNKEEKVKELQEKRVQELINVKDIVENKLYTKDGYILGYVKVVPVNISLLSKREKIRKRDMLKEKLNNENEFEFLKLSKSVDLSEQLNYYQNLAKEEENHLKKMAQLETIRAISRYSQQGEMVDNQYYYMFKVKNEDSHAEKELDDKLNDFVNKLLECEIKSSILTDMEITEVCNLFCNPTSYSDEFELNEYVSTFTE